MMNENKPERNPLNPLDTPVAKRRKKGKRGPTLKSVLKSVQRDGLKLQFVPVKSRTKELCLAAVQQDARALQLVPEERKTEEMCLAAVQNIGWTLEWVPEELKTKELCLAAIQENICAFRYIPEKYRTMEMYNTYVSSGYCKLESFIASIPEKFWNIELCETIAARHNYKNFMLMPKTAWTLEKCQAIIKIDGRALAVIPKRFRTPEVCLQAIKNEKSAQYDIPYDVVLNALQSYVQ